MNRDNIDFTKTNRCCICGVDGRSGLHLNRVLVQELYTYTNAHVLMCDKCSALSGAVRHESGSHSDSFLVRNIDIKDKVASKMKSLQRDIETKIKEMVAAREDIGMLLHAGDEYQSPSFCLETPHWITSYAIEDWIGAKENAYQEKLATYEAFLKAKGMNCTVCGEKLDATRPEEIKDVITFSCPNGCLSFTDIDLIKRFYASYLSHRFPRNSSPRPSLGVYAIEGIEHVLCSMQEFFNELRRKYYREEINICSLHKNSRGCIGCNNCYEEADKDHMEKMKELRRLAADVYGWGGKSKMSLEELIKNYKESDLYGAEKHCKFFCKFSPDDGRTNMCGATGYKCGFCNGEKSCRTCFTYKEGEPIGNFLATHSMCDNYADGRCLKHCGFKTDFLQNKYNLGVCAYDGNEYVFTNRGYPCGAFRLKNNIDLTVAAKESKRGRSHKG